MTLDDLNAADAPGFAHLLEGVFENAPWVAHAAASQRPFASVEALHAALLGAVRAASAETQLAFLRGHPALSPKAVVDPEVSADSRAEQKGLGLGALGSELDRFVAMTRAYDAKFGFPFILCVRRHTAAEALRQLETRLDGEAATEAQAALREIGYITRLRLDDRISAAP